jgi:hypothetical protein
VEVRDSGGSLFHAEATYCDGASGAVVAALYCDIPASVLRAAPFNLGLQALVVAQVRAYNVRGWSAYSPANTAGALIETEPTQMPAPTRGGDTSTDRLQVQWNSLSSPDDGYSVVTTYALYWDAGTGGTTFTALVGVASDYLLTSYLVTTDVTMGASYQFKAQARNYWGWGALSTVGTVKAATTPAAPASAPTTAVDAATGDVTISWLAADARGDAVVSYTVEIENALASAWTAETVNCGGSTALTCQVPMSVLTAAPYSLPQGQLVKVRVYASNAYGAGAPSAANTAGADVRVAPVAMGPPTRGAQTSTG